MDHFAASLWMEVSKSSKGPAVQLNLRCPKTHLLPGTTKHLSSEINPMMGISGEAPPMTGMTANTYCTILPEQGE